MTHKKLVPLFSLVLVLAFLFTGIVPVAAQPKETIRVWVEYQSDKKADVEKALKAQNAEFHYDFADLNAYVVTMPTAALNGITKNPHVLSVEEDVLRFPMAADFTTLNALLSESALPAQVVPWGVDAVQARDVWDADRDGTVDAGAPTGAGIKVCIIDTGYYLGHEDLPSNVSGMSQVGGTWAEDGAGHGSHVAGTITGLNNGIGVVGVTPGTVDLFIVKIFDNDGLWTTSSNLTNAINTCAANGADVISMSLGGGTKSKLEERAFNTIYSQGILSIAAAGNDGTTALSYPASYASVMSVAAVDESLTKADFSQYNSAVEIAAPGVSVLSTIPYLETNTLTVGANSFSPLHVEFAAYGSASGTLVDGGLCTAANSAWSGKVVICQRGDIAFYDKVMNVQNSGGKAAIIYNNIADEVPAFTLGDGNSSTIVAQALTQADGLWLIANALGQTAALSSTYEWPISNYEYYDGTSMATPHVSAVAALVWSANPAWTNAQIREALTASAKDLGTAGKDNLYGYGLVQAKDALTYLGWGGTTNTDPTLSITSPANNTSYTQGSSVTFTASASDAEDGDLSGSVSWVSSLDGALGTGASIVASALSVGTHTITASVSDSAGASASASITVTITPTAGGALSVVVATDKATYVDKQKVIITTTVTSGGAPVSGASVSLVITTANGTKVNASGTTGTNGVFTYTYRLNAVKTGKGTYSATSTAVKTGYTSGSGTVTFIVN